MMLRGEINDSDGHFMKIYWYFGYTLQYPSSENIEIKWKAE